MLTYSQVKQCIEEIGRNELEDLINRHGEEMVESAFNCDVQPSDIDESYQGKYRSDEEFAEETAESIGAINRELNWPYTCIDWDHAAKELMFDYSEDNGYYWRNI